MLKKIKDLLFPAKSDRKDRWVQRYTALSPAQLPATTAYTDSAQTFTAAQTIANNSGLTIKNTATTNSVAVTATGTNQLTFAGSARIQSDSGLVLLNSSAVGGTLWASASHEISSDSSVLIQRDEGIALRNTAGLGGRLQSTGNHSIVLDSGLALQYDAGLTIQNSALSNSASITATGATELTSNGSVIVKNDNGLGIRTGAGLGGRFTATGNHALALDSGMSVQYDTGLTIQNTALTNSMSITASTPTVNGQIGYDGTHVLVKENGAVHTTGAPIGALAQGLTAPDSTWLKCNGQALSQSTYATLFSQVGIQPSLTSSWRSVLAGNLIDVAYSSGLGMYVAIGNTGAAGQTVWTSTDGQNWNSANTAGVGPAAPTAIAYCSGLGMFVICQGNTVVWTSTNGTDWTPSLVASDAVVSFVACSSTTIVLGGASDSDNSIQNIWYSTDGVAWTKQAISGNPNSAITALHWAGSLGAGAFYAGFANGNIQSSPDATVWTSWTSNIASQINQFASYASLIVAVGNAGVISTSPNGTTWTARTSQLTGHNLLGVAYLSGATVPWVACGVNCILSSADGTTWTVQADQFNGKGGIAYSTGDSAYVATGLTGFVATSTDLNTWTGRTAGSPISTQNAAACNGSTYVTVGGAGVIQSSTNSGSTWTARTANAGANALNHVIYIAGGTNLFIVCGAGNIINTSPDGTTWTARTSNITSTINAIAFKTGTDLMVAVGTAGAITTSTNGTTWTSRTSNTGQALNGVAWNGTIFCAVGQGVVLTSTDGTTWTKRSPTGALNNVAWNWVTSDGTSFYAIENTATNSIVWQSTDGITWTPYASPMVLLSLNWINSKLVGYSTNGDICSSADGKVWTVASNSRGVVTFNKAYALNSKFYLTQAVGGMHTSSDGVTFKGQYSATPTFITYSSAQTKLVATGANGLVMYSTDGGTTWTQVYALSTSTGVNAQAVVWSPDLSLYAIGGNAGQIWTSSDAVTWTQRSFTHAFMGSSPLNTSFNCGVWSSAKTLFVLTGGGGTIATSPDGTTWTTRGTPGANSINQVCYNVSLGKFVAVGNFAYTLSSTNGTSWTPHPVGLGFGGLGRVESLESDGFLAISEQSNMLTSPDGATWTYTQGVQGTTGNASKALRSSVDNGVMWVPNATSGVGGQLIFSNDGSTYSLTGVEQIASGVTNSCLAYDSTNDAYVLVSSGGTPAGAYVFKLSRTYNKSTQFALPKIQNTWIKVL
jgi:photosystem II stability/assembly factor-like uncharacterized protein